MIVTFSAALTDSRPHTICAVTSPNGYGAILTESRSSACLSYRLDRMEGCQPARFHVHDSAKWHGVAAACRGILHARRWPSHRLPRLFADA